MSSLKRGEFAEASQPVKRDHQSVFGGRSPTTFTGAVRPANPVPVAARAAVPDLESRRVPTLTTASTLRERLPLARRSEGCLHPPGWPSLTRGAAPPPCEPPLAVPAGRPRRPVVHRRPARRRGQ